MVQLGGVTGRAVRFEVNAAGVTLEGFVIRVNGRRNWSHSGHYGFQMGFVELLDAVVSCEKITAMVSWEIKR